MPDLPQNEQKTDLEQFPSSKAIERCAKFKRYMETAAKEGRIEGTGRPLFEMIALFLAAIPPLPAPPPDPETKVMLFVMARTLVSAIDETQDEEVNAAAGFRRDETRRLLETLKRVLSEELAPYP